MKKVYAKRNQRPDHLGRLCIMVRLSRQEYDAIDRARGPEESRGAWVRKVVAEALKTQPQ